MRRAHRAKSPMERGIKCDVRQVAIEILRGLDTPYSVHLSDLLTAGLDQEYLDAALPECSSSDEFRDCLMAKELVSKWPGLRLPVDRKAAAIKSFLDAEKTCAEASDRLRRKEVDGLYSPYTPRNVLYVARRKILRLLGPFHWDHAARYFRFSSGASLGLKRDHGDAYYKYGAKPQATEDCAILAYTAIKQCPRWLFHAVSSTGLSSTDLRDLSLTELIKAVLDIVPGNRITTVPKNAKTERVIAIEPHLNMYLQLGIGGVIRSRLKRVSIDLDDQSRNQRLAGLHPDFGMCTIDLKAASDSVSLGLVESLLPNDWVTALKQVRSPVGVLPDGTAVRYQKVSSMGNGCTFELESLIFWAICSACADVFRCSGYPIGVYGDDLIVHRDFAHQVCWMLDYCGFATNVKKTHLAGPYRESCGKHAFLGSDVTPFYIREDVKTPAELFVVANNLRRWAAQYSGFDCRVEKAYRLLVRSLPESLQRPRIPDGIGDLALIGTLDEVLPRRHPCWDGWVVPPVWMSFMTVKQPGDDMYLLRQLAPLDKHSVVRFDGCLGPFVDGWTVVEPALGSGVPTGRRVWRRVVKLFVKRWDVGKLI